MSTLFYKRFAELQNSEIFLCSMKLREKFFQMSLNYKYCYQNALERLLEKFGIQKTLRDM